MATTELSPFHRAPTSLPNELWKAGSGNEAKLSLSISVVQPAVVEVVVAGGTPLCARAVAFSASASITSLRDAGHRAVRCRVRVSRAARERGGDDGG